MARSLRERALQLLARREHSRLELARKLAPHAESEEQLAALLEDLCERNFLSDARYVDARLHTRGARLGDARIAHELRRQGVSAELISQAISAGEDEFVRAQRVWQQKFAIAPSDDRQRVRQVRFLMSRGFSSESIRRVLRLAVQNPAPNSSDLLFDPAQDDENNV